MASWVHDLVKEPLITPNSNTPLPNFTNYMSTIPHFISFCLTLFHPTAPHSTPPSSPPHSTPTFPIPPCPSSIHPNLPTPPLCPPTYPILTPNLPKLPMNQQCSNELHWTVPHAVPATADTRPVYLWCSAALYHGLSVALFAHHIWKGGKKKCL